MRRSWGIAALVGGTLALLGAVSPVAAAMPTSTGFTISPAFQEVSVKAGEPRQQYSLQLTNRTAADQTFRLSLVDFGALDESGGVAFLGAPASELEHRYGLASWMTLEKDAVVVAAGKSANVVVTIENRASLAAGGHYGAVLATAVTDTGQPTADPRVGVKQVLSSLVLAIKEGDSQRSLNLVSQTDNHTWWRLPTKLTHRFQNLGNIHVQPRGVSEVRSPLGGVVYRGALNENSNPILPDSFRRYEVKLSAVDKAWMPGRYSVITTYRYDGTSDTKQYTQHVWYAGLLIVWLVALGGLVVIGLLGWWLLRRHRRR